MKIQHLRISAAFSPIDSLYNPSCSGRSPIASIVLRIWLSCDSEMDPPIGASVTRVNSHRWILGSSIICEKAEDSKLKPTNEIVHWQDGGSTFYLRENTESLGLAGDSDIDRNYLAGTQVAAWSIGDNAICKVHSWCEGLPLEADAIRFVRQYAEEVPVPEVVYTWIDHKLDRTFLITKRINGETLDQAWPRLDKIKRERLADEVARYCAILAMKTSSLFESATGGAVFEPFLTEHEPKSHPSWKKTTVGPFSSNALATHMKEISTKPPPDFDAPFHFSHALLHPESIMVSGDDGVLTGIIDWEIASYYPRFWIATKTATYKLECDTDEPRLWGELLRKALEAEGFMPSDKWRPWSLGVREKSGQDPYGGSETNN